MSGSSSNIPRRPPGPGGDAPAPPTQAALPVEAADVEGTPAEVEAPSAIEAAAEVDAEVEASSDFDMGLDDETVAPSLRAGAAVIHGFWKTLPGAPGVYRMTGAAGEVLYVGKARNLKRRVASYARGIAPTTRIARMIAETAAMEFVTTETETEALLLEANLIKQLKPRYNVLLRDDKSFPYILISGDHAAPQIAKHRGARSRKGDYYGPFANAGAVNRTVNALQRAFLLRSCSDSYYDNRTRPCLLFQIKRCSAPCTGEISLADYAELVDEARGFLCGRSNAVKRTLAAEMLAAAEALEFERAARYRDRLAALSAVQTSQDINPQSVEEADVFAIDLQAGQFCIEVFFFRNSQNWGNRAYFPRADKSLAAAEVLASFIAQFYDDKPCPRLVLLSQPVDDQELLAEALSARAGRRVELVVPQRGEKRDLVDHAARNAREALGRRLADTASQHKLLGSLGAAFGLAEAPRRIEVYDNSHIRGANAVGAMIVAGAAGFMKAHYRTFNIRSLDLTPGDDYAMMRDVLRRRFARLLKEAPRPPGGAAAQAGDDGPNRACADLPPEAAELPGDADADDAAGEELFPAWPDLVIIDGGRGQLEAARATLGELGLNDVALVGIAKGPDRDAGRESFFMVGRGPFKLAPRDPALYFVQRMRDEAHRFAIGTHRARRKKDLVRSPLDEVPGIGPARKRALLMHFGTAKAVSRASLDDLRRVPGVNAATAKVVYDHFHDEAS